MHDIVIEIRHYVQNATRYKWVSLLIVWIICLSGWTYISQMPDEFKSNARVHVDTRSVLRPLLKGIAIHPDIEGQIRLMTRLMFTRPNLEKIARMTDLDLDINDEEGMDELVKKLESSMSISAAQRSNLFSITAVDSNPKTAKTKSTVFIDHFRRGDIRRDAQGFE